MFFEQFVYQLLNKDCLIVVCQLCPFYVINEHLVKTV